MDKLNEYMFSKKQNFLFFLSIFSGIFLIDFTLDNDVWFLLNGGRYVLEHGIPFTEPFTMHSDMKFVMQQWLSGVIFWIIYAQGSATYLIALVYLTFIATVFIVYRLCLLVSNGNYQISVFVTTGIGILIPVFMRTRPQIISALFLCFALYCLELYSQKKELKFLFPLPILSFLLVNFHASLWIMLFVIMLPYVIDSFSFKLFSIKNNGYTKLPLFLCISGMIFLGFVNPYGIDAMTYIFRSYGYDSINAFVGEMKPLSINNFSGKIGYCSIAFPLFCYVACNKESFKLRYVLLTIGFAYLAMTSVRGLLLFWVCGLFPLAYVFKDCSFLKQTIEEHTPQTHRLRKILLILLGAALIVLIYKQYGTLSEELILMLFAKILLILIFFLVFSLLYAIKDYFSQPLPKTSSSYMQGLKKITAILLGIALAILSTLGDHKGTSKESLAQPPIDYLLEKLPPESITLWVGYNDGAYAGFKKIPCYMDARAEVFLFKNNEKKEIFDEYLDLERGNLHYKKFIERYPFTHFLTTKSDILYTYLYHDDDYTLLFEDDYCRLFEKKRT